MDKKLSYKDAFLAMTYFLEEYYSRIGSDDVGSLLGDLIILEDGITADPAAWQDWIKCVKKVEEKDK